MPDLKTQAKSDAANAHSKDGRIASAHDEGDGCQKEHEDENAWEQMQGNGLANGMLFIRFNLLGVHIYLHFGYY